MAQKQSRFMLMLLGLIAAAILVLLGGGIGWYHAHQRVLVLKQEKAAKTEERDQVKEAIAQLDSRKAELQRLETRLATLDQNLADYKYIPTYLHQIQRATVMSGNTILAIYPRELRVLDLTKHAFLTGSVDNADAPPPAVLANMEEQKSSDDATKYRVQQISLEVRGNYFSLLRLLDTLRQFPKMVYVQAINISPQQREGLTGIVARVETYAIITPDQYQEVDTTTEEGTP
jgi:Tfp pilus assembly protein PilO